MTRLQEAKLEMANHNKIKLHNAKQSALRLAQETELLMGKIDAHIMADGLHLEKFCRARTHLNISRDQLREAFAALR